MNIIVIIISLYVLSITSFIIIITKRKEKKLSILREISLSLPPHKENTDMVISDVLDLILNYNEKENNNPNLDNFFKLSKKLKYLYLQTQDISKLCKEYDVLKYCLRSHDLFLKYLALSQMQYMDKGIINQFIDEIDRVINGNNNDLKLMALRLLQRRQ